MLDIIEFLNSENVFLEPYAPGEPSEIIQQVLDNGSEPMQQAIANAYNQGLLVVKTGDSIPSVKPPIIDHYDEKTQQPMFLNGNYEKAALTQILVPSWARHYHPEGFQCEETYLTWYQAYIDWAAAGKPIDTNRRKNMKQELKELWQLVVDARQARKEADAVHKEKCNRLYNEYMEKKKSFDNV